MSERNRKASIPRGYTLIKHQPVGGEILLPNNCRAVSSNSRASPGCARASWHWSCASVSPCPLYPWEWTCSASASMSA